MPTNSGLNTGLLISRDDIITWGEGSTFPFLGVKIQYPAGFLQEVRVSWVDPRPMKPRAKSIFMQPSGRC